MGERGDDFLVAPTPPGGELDGGTGNDLPAVARLTTSMEGRETTASQGPVAAIAPVEAAAGTFSWAGRDPTASTPATPNATGSAAAQAGIALRPTQQTGYAPASGVVPDRVVPGLRPMRLDNRAIPPSTSPLSDVAAQPSGGRRSLRTQPSPTPRAPAGRVTARISAGCDFRRPARGWRRPRQRRVANGRGRCRPAGTFQMSPRRWTWRPFQSQQGPMPRRVSALTWWLRVARRRASPTGLVLSPTCRRPAHSWRQNPRTATNREEEL